MSDRHSEQLPPIGLRGILITLCATLSTALYGYTWNSVTVALPHMKGAFSSSTDQITWVMISFVIGSAMMTASIGFLADRFGRKEVFMFALVGFLATLIGCAFATTLLEMVAWRFIQGICGAALLPLGQSIAVSAFPAERRGQATALWALGFVTSNVVSPAIAGVIVEEVGWQAIFSLPIVFGLPILVLSLILLPRESRQPRSLDFRGYAALLIGVSALQLMLARGERLDWFESTEILIETAVALGGIYIFIVHTTTAANPFFDRALFANRNFNLGVLFIFIIASVLFLPMLFLPLQLQQIGGYPAISIGFLLLARGVGSIIGLLVMARFRDRTDPRPLLLIGLLGTSLSSWAMSLWTVDIRPFDVVWTNLVHGIATGAVWAPLNTLTLGWLNKRLQDQGFAFFYLAFDIGSAIGTALVVGFHARSSQINRTILTEHITPFVDLEALGQDATVWSTTSFEGLASMELEVVRQAAMIAFNNSYMIIGLVLASLIPFIVFFKYPFERAQG